LVSAARSDALIEAAQRPGRADRGQRRLDQDVPDGGRALFGDPPGVAGAVAGLAHARIEAEVADESSWRGEPVDVPAGGPNLREERRGGDHPDTGNGEQPAGVGGGEHELGEVVLDRGDFRGEEVDLTQRRVDGVSLVGRERLPGEPLTAGDTERVGHRRAVLEVAVQRCEDLVLAPRTSHDEVRATPGTSTSRPRVLVRQPRVLEHPGRQHLRERSGVVAVGLLLRLRDRCELTSVDDHDLCDVRADDPRDRQRVPRRLERHPVIRSELLGELLDRPRPGADPRPVRDLPSLADRDFTEVAVHV